MTPEVRRIRRGLYSVRTAGRSYEIALDLRSDEAAVAYVDGTRVPIEIEDKLQRALASLGAGIGRSSHGAITVTAPMPGRIVALPAAGTQVERGQPVVVLEAMKMESTISAPAAGTVAEVLVQPGQPVKQRQPLLRIDSTPD